MMSKTIFAFKSLRTSFQMTYVRFYTTLCFVIYFSPKRKNYGDRYYKPRCGQMQKKEKTFCLMMLQRKACVCMCVCEGTFEKMSETYSSKAHVFEFLSVKRKIR